jgi:alanyl aminopeptidase
VRLFVDRFTYKSATSDDFMTAIAEGSGDREIVPALRSFLDQPGVPLLETTLECVADEAPVVHVSQSRYAPLGSTIDADAQTWRIPACFAYSVDGAVARACELVSEREQTIALDVEGCPSSILPNADGAGYYRFALDEAGWSALIADSEQYSASEALALVDSLGASFRAGEASADAYVAGLAALARHPAWDVVQAVAGDLRSTAILEDDQLDAVRPQLAALFRDRSAAVSSAEDGGDLLLRNTLTSFLAFTAEDPEIRGELTALAARRIGIRGEPDWSYVPRERLGLVMGVGVQELDARFFDLVLGEALASDDAAFRRDALAALARSDDPTLAARLRAALLDERLRGNEAVGVLGAQLSRPALREETWEWIKANGAAVIQLAPDSFRSQSITRLGTAFCSTDLSAEFAAFIESHAAALPGYERSLAQAQESAALCATLKEASADDLAAALSRLGE